MAHSFLFGFSMLCEYTVVNIYKLRIHYIVNIIHLFSSLFDQLFNKLYIEHMTLFYLLWTVITIAWFQDLHKVNEV